MVRPKMYVCRVLLAFLMGGCALTSPVCGQTLNSSRLQEFSLLGMDESTLLSQVPEVKPVLKPLLGPRGERGRWQLSQTLLFGVPFDTIFYMKNGRVTRIEKLWSTTNATCAGGLFAEDMLGKLRAEYGEGLASNMPGRNESPPQSAVWAVDDAQLSMHTEVSLTKCSTRLVLQPRIVKDGSEL